MAISLVKQSPVWAKPRRRLTIQPVPPPTSSDPSGYEDLPDLLWPLADKRGTPRHGQRVTFYTANTALLSSKDYRYIISFNMVSTQVLLW